MAEPLPELVPGSGGVELPLAGFLPAEVTTIGSGSVELLASNSTMNGSFGEGMTAVKVDSSVALNLYSILYICIGSCGVLGNLLVVLVMMSSRELRGKITNIFIIDQSLVDAVASIVLIAHSTSQYYSGGYVGIMGLLRCKLWTNKWFMWHMFVTSSYNLLFLTFERYVHILYPFKYQAYFNKRIIAIMIFTAWVFPFTYKSPLFIHTTVVRNEICYVMVDWQDPAIQQFWGILTALLQYFIPLGVMIFCYYRMIAMLRRKPFGAGSGPGNDSTDKKRDEKMARASRNILKTLVLVCVAFATCWINNQVYFLMFNLGYPVDFNGTYFHFTVIMVFLNCCINPFIYALQYHPFQQQVSYLFCHCCHKGNTDTSGGGMGRTGVSGSAATLSSAVSG